MKIYMAPMEGITGHNFRNAYRHHFADADRYFTPFISTHKKLGWKVLEEIDPDDNRGQELVPQVMAASAAEFFELQEQLEKYGYLELNINAGCPSGTVVGKHRGAGLLKNPWYLEDVLTEIFDHTQTPVSIKTRIGWEDPSEWDRLSEILGQFPFSEVIIHTRVREEYYNGSAHREAMAAAHENIHCPICFNGDIFDISDISSLEKEYPWLDAVMIGRGILRSPWLISQAKGDTGASDPARVYEFVDELFDTYLAKWGSEINTLYHMKEVWSHLGQSYPEHEKELKIIRKTKTAAEYKAAVRSILL